MKELCDPVVVHGEASYSYSHFPEDTSLAYKIYIILMISAMLCGFFFNNHKIQYFHFAHMCVHTKVRASVVKDSYIVVCFLELKIVTKWKISVEVSNVLPVPVRK